MDEELHVALPATNRRLHLADDDCAADLKCVDHLGASLGVQGRIGDDTFASIDVSLARLKLGLHEQHELAIPAGQSDQHLGDEGQGDEREIGDHEIKRRSQGDRIGMANVGPFNHRYPGIEADFGMQLAVPDINGDHVTDVALQHAVGKTTGRSSNVDGAQLRNVNGEMVQRRSQFFPAPTDEGAIRPVNDDRFIGAHQSGRVERRCAAHSYPPGLNDIVSLGGAADQTAPNEFEIKSSPHSRVEPTH